MEVKEFVLPACGISFWMFRGGAAELMQHGLASIEGQIRGEEVRKVGSREEKQTKLEGEQVGQLLLAVASCLPCFNIPLYVNS